MFLRAAAFFTRLMVQWEKSCSVRYSPWVARGKHRNDETTTVREMPVVCLPAIQASHKKSQCLIGKVNKSLSMANMLNYQRANPNLNPHFLVRKPAAEYFLWCTQTWGLFSRDGQYNYSPNPSKESGNQSLNGKTISRKCRHVRMERHLNVQHLTTSYNHNPKIDAHIEA